MEYYIEHSLHRIATNEPHQGSPQLVLNEHTYIHKGKPCIRTRYQKIFEQQTYPLCESALLAAIAIMVNLNDGNFCGR